jgi:molybdenum cofactor synthesis domain-containing protein
MFTARVITVSDRSYRGERPDAGGPAVRQMLEEAGYAVDGVVIVPDEEPEIRRALVEAAGADVALVVTTGGTGFAPRDVTPEATKDVIEREVPGIPEAIRAESLKITPKAMLSRATAGIRGKTLIINLPGSPKAVRESLAVVVPVLDHALETLSGVTLSCGKE